MTTFYDITNLIHLLMVIMWIGPPLGAYYVLVQAYRDGEKERIVWAERCCERVLVAEHIAFALLLVTGILMMWLGPWSLATSWLKTKLLLVVGIVVFEVFDIWLAHRVFAGLLRRPDPLEEDEWSVAVHRRKQLMFAALPVAAFFIPGVFVYAVLKI